MVGVSAPDYLQQLNVKPVILQLSIYLNTVQNLWLRKCHYHEMWRLLKVYQASIA